MPGDTFRLSVLSDTFAVCRLNGEETIPHWAYGGEFFSITRTADELSIVCAQANVPADIHEDVKCEKGWRSLRIEGTLDFALIGVLASLTTILAQAEVSVFAVSTFDTDYLLIKEDKLERAIEALTAQGHHVTR